MARTSRPTAVCLIFLFGLFAFASEAVVAQTDGAIVHLRLQRNGLKPSEHLPPAAIWLQPRQGTSAPPFTQKGPYTLAQKNRTFVPHLLVVPVGTIVHFPNEDPFFHNVFSLFNGKKFDLGLYEAGSTKDVEFTREGVSYIFCNIHPEMSAVVLALSTPLYAVAGRDGTMAVHGVPQGDYVAHVWIEGMSQPELDRLARNVHVDAVPIDLGAIDAAPKPSSPTHLNKFGQPYDKDAKPPY